MNAPMPAVRHRNTYQPLVENIEHLDYPAPMPATQYRPGPRIWRGIGYAFLFQTAIFASIGLVLVAAAIAIGAGLRILGGV